MPSGTDIVKISRMEQLLKKAVPTKIFAKYEAEYILSSPRKYETAAGIYAAKEAILKSLGKGLLLPLKEICIKHRSGGSPYAELSGTVLEYAEKYGVENIDISISHDGEYAIATAHADINKYQKLFFKALRCFENNTDANIITPSYAHSLIIPRNSQSHKGDYGRLSVLAGSVGLTGAATLSCDSALKCGAGLITLLCPEELNTIFECKLTETMTKPVKSTDGHISSLSSIDVIKAISSGDVCLMGPGLGRSEDACAVVTSAIENTDKPLIIDADALYAVSKNTNILKNRKGNIILTPHIGEFSRLTGMDTKEILSDTQKYAMEFSQEYNVIVVLKSHRTIVCTPNDECYSNILGNPGMATGGSGDVLAGCIASFAAQGMKLVDAAKLGVYIHSLSADMAKEDTGEYSLTPSDIIRYLPYAIKYTEKKELD